MVPLAIKSNGALYAFGLNSSGQLGDGTTTNQSSPIPVSVIPIGWNELSVGAAFTDALKSDGTLWAWGVGNHGQLGGGNNSNKNIPSQIGTATNWKFISAGQEYSLAIKQDGTLWAWGNNFFGQLGDGTTADKNAPTQIGTGNNWQSVTAGKYHSQAVKQDGTLWAWGYNNHGQLGDGTLTDKNTPTQIGVAANWKNISSYQGYHSMVIKQDGTLWTWGYNASGQLGDGTNTDKAAPAQIAGSCIALPVELLSFSGKNYNKYNKLQWVTTAEINNKYFILERSSDV